MNLEPTKPSTTDRDAPIYDRVIPLAEHGSAHLTITEQGTWIALNGKATQLRCSAHGSDLANLVLLLTEGMTARRRARVDRRGEEAGID